jgi:hypothetical protein
LAGLSAGGADRHADARLVEVRVTRTERAVYSDGKVVIPSKGGSLRKGRASRDSP